MRVILATLAALAIQPAFGEIDGVPRGPDLDDIFARLSGSVYVVKGKVLETKPAGSYSAPMFNVTDEKQIEQIRANLRKAAKPLSERQIDEMIQNATRTEPPNEQQREEILKKGGFILMETRLGGLLITVSVEQVICRQSDFSATESQVAPLADPVHLFVPFQEPARRSSLSAGRFVVSEYLEPGGAYLLFLRAISLPAELSGRQGLDPSLTYYRALEGKRGAVRLPDAAHPEEPYAFTTPLVSAVTGFCDAVKPADLATKIRNLNAVKGQLADPAWRQSVDAAINALQQPQAVAPKR